MALVRFTDVCLEFGDQPLLQEASFSLEPGERVCLIGRNGAGKSSLLKLVAGHLEADRGEIYRRAGTRIGELEQQLPSASDIRVYDYVAGGLAGLKAMRNAYERRTAADLDSRALKELERLQRDIEAQGGWHMDQQVESILSELDLPGTQPLAQLSGGWRRRVALGRALVNRPDILLLDEPTNHLDFNTIAWLEQTVRGFPGSVLFVTHDRALLQSLATCILELDRGALTSWPGDYQNYLVRKEKALEDEERHKALFDKKLAREEVWIRQGIKARRTRNEGRVRALEALRSERAQRLQRAGKAEISVTSAERSGRKVIEARNVTHGYDGRTLIRNFSVTIMRGDRIGIIGNNGVGKSTLLGILLGEIIPQNGSVKSGTNLAVGYFDQLRSTLDPERSVADNVSDGREFITVNGKERHIISYLQSFLFPPQRVRSPVKALSGGEANRVILARLFARAANLLVLDEPTNDLDVETLEVLEQRLVEFDGTLIVVSHDRAFLDNVVTSTLVFEPEGQVGEYAGGYRDWLTKNRRLALADGPGDTTTRPARPATPAPATSHTRTRKLSYHLQRELDALPDRIESLETCVETLQAQTLAGDFYTLDHTTVRSVLDELSTAQTELEDAIARWAELEEGG